LHRVRDHTLHITAWLNDFASTVLEAVAYSQRLINFLISKARLHDRVRGQFNTRQEKALTRMFSEGVEGFKSGLSAENYINITGASRATTTRDLHKLLEFGA